MTKLHFNDLTQITCPFGMLDDDTQERLKACDETEFWNDGRWNETTGFKFQYLTYRAKPQPKRFVAWVPWDADDDAVCCETRKDAVWYLKNYGGYIYRIERDEDGSNPTIELVETGGNDE